MAEIEKRPYIIRDASIVKERIHYVINPNKFNIDAPILSISDFVATITLIIEDMGLTDYEWRLERVDITFDSTIDYDSLYKINCYLKELYTVHIDCRNAYRVIGDDMRKRSTIVKNPKYELEIYNKQIESNNFSLPQTRIEFRHKQVYRRKQYDVMQTVSQVIKRVIGDITNLQKNICILENIKKPILLKSFYRESTVGCEGRTLNLKEFALKFSDYIYTRTCLEFLYDSIENGANFTSWLNRYRKGGHVLTMISEKTMKIYCALLLSALNTYITNPCISNSL